MRPRGTTGLVAAIATGIGLWFTRGILDVVPTAGGDARVAMLGSWPELVGLVCLVLLTAFLARSLMVRLGRGATHGIPRPGHVPPHVLLPLVLVLALGLPYLPWIPDALPVLRVLAGPARYGLWIVALGLTAWLAWEFHAGARDSRPARPGTRDWTPGAVFLLTAVLLGSAAGQLAGHGLYPGGDEPHYLVITQSVLADHDLRIENNHARRDYAAYFAGTRLDPDYIARGRDGAIYPIHPVGLPLLIAPAFALGGYRAVTWLLVLVSAGGAALLWRVARRVTGSASAATAGWLAVAGATPFVLLGFSVYPEITAATCALAALCWPGRDEGDPVWVWLLRGVAVALLPWLGTKYSPMSAVIVGALALRAWNTASVARVAAAVLPWGASVAGWLAFFWTIWGVPSPAAPYGTATQTSFGNVLLGAPALFVDQEYGVFTYAPALMLAIPGLWRMWRDGGASRRLAIEIALAIGALATTVGAYQMWWGGSAAPGRQVGAALLLAGVPVARWDAHVAAHPVRRALVRTLVLVGLAASLAMVVGRDGLLVANGRDGASQLLEWLAPGHELVRGFPSAILLRGRPLIFFAGVALWAALVAGASFLARRWTTPSAGHAGAAAGVLTLATLVAGGSIAPALLRADAPPRAAVARVESTLLDEFDARRRPLSIVYDPFERVASESLPARFRFEGAADVPRPRQPVRMLFNTRLSLPAGDYGVRVTAKPGAALAGAVALQVGLAGPPMIEWTANVARGEPWIAAFTLGVDANFVGVRAAPEFEARAAALEIVPRHVLDRSERPDVPQVLSAVRYGPVDVYFHSTDVYPERTGFWVRGRASLPATFVQSPPADADPWLTLRVHTGGVPARVRFATPLWQTAIDFAAGESRAVRIPARPGTRVVPVTMTPESGFVPAETRGGDDRRLLGCWVEVVD